jgi:hypothetical protein
MRTYQQCFDVLGVLKRHKNLIKHLKGLIFQPHYWNADPSKFAEQKLLEHRIIDLLKDILRHLSQLEIFVWETWDRPYDDEIWELLRIWSVFRVSCFSQSF